MVLLAVTQCQYKVYNFIFVEFVSPIGITFETTSQ